jgi:hypothetical protein
VKVEGSTDRSAMSTVLRDRYEETDSVAMQIVILILSVIVHLGGIGWMWIRIVSCFSWSLFVFISVQ